MLYEPDQRIPIRACPYDSCTFGIYHLKRENRLLKFAIINLVVEYIYFYCNAS